MKREKKEFTAKDFSDFLASRHSTRDFLPTPIPQEILDQILKDALTAPSWSNTRPFKVAIATGEQRERISREFLSRWNVLSKIMRKGILSKLRILYSRYGLPTSNRTIAKPYPSELKPRAERLGKELYEVFGVTRGDTTARNAQWAKNYSFFGAPVEIFVFIHKSLHIFAASDAGLMMQNLILSAHAKGLGTCAQGAVGIWEDVVRKEFEISKDYRLLCGIALGYPSESAVNDFAANRIDISEILAKPKNLT
jgi:nitroreductase